VWKKSYFVPIKHTLYPHFCYNIDACLVPYIETEDEIFLKTIIPSRKATRQYLGEQDEVDILQSYEAGEWHSTGTIEKEVERFREIARAAV